MATLTIRNLDDTVVTRLKERAKAHNRSLEAEVREILAHIVEGRVDKGPYWALADRIAARTRDIPQTDSTLLIRQDRDR